MEPEMPDLIMAVQHALDERDCWQSLHPLEKKKENARCLFLQAGISFPTSGLQFTSFLVSYSRLVME
tara:strand:+ start:1272 stop:1472 length:201 start_codon:yes stop_codon:yes gene_type:complete